MDVEIEAGDGVVRVIPAGPRLDAAAAPAFKAVVTAALPAAPLALLIDATRLSFVDSTGLGTLVSLMKGLGDGGTMAVVGAAPNLQRLLALTGLDQLFRQFPDMASAEAALESRA